MTEQNKNTASDVLNDANNPMNVNDTYQTTNKDGTIKEEYRVDGLLDDASNTPINRYSNTPNTTTDAVDSKTGSGLKAAEGTNYSWETKAEERAKLDYESSVLETKSNMLQNRQDLESKGQQFQDQFAMQQYTKNQSIDKVGWTGGYVLDSERQVNYLKQTIQAQMYGQMELQKYGYDTSLAAARLAYDTNRYDLALEYYNTALSRAVSEAEITGYYVSPETNEMLDQYSIASKTLNDPNAKEEDKLRADKILTSVYEWFEGHGISKQGVETYNHIVQERTHKMSVEQTLDYINKANKQIDSNTFTKLDANGNAIIGKDGTTMETINFSTSSTEDLLDYIGSNEMAKQQYYGYLDTKITGETTEQFKNWLITNGLMNKSEDGKTYTAKADVDYQNKLYEFLKSSAIYQQIVDEVSGDSLTDTQRKQLERIYNDWDFEVSLPDGSSMIVTLDNLEQRITEQENAKTSGSLQELTNKNEQGEYTTNFNPQKQTITISGNTSEAVYIKDSNLILWSVQAQGGSGYKEDDITLSNGIGDKYNIELAENAGAGSINNTDSERIKEIYERTYGKTISNGAVIIYNDQVYMYCEGQRNNGNKTENYSGFSKVKGQCGKSGASDLIKDVKGAVGA